LYPVRRLKEDEVSAKSLLSGDLTSIEEIVHRLMRKRARFVSTFERTEKERSRSFRASKPPENPLASETTLTETKTKGGEKEKKVRNDLQYATGIQESQS
jgi:hypothetical protein